MADHSSKDVLELPFRPRARLLQLLGDQLIGTPRLAVFELVKNAYDADAERVTVTLEGLGTSSPSIIVQDDGDGMSLSTIRDIWLVPADDHRERQRKELRRTRLNRLPLGEKGLGRFAAHKLGDQIELVTRAKNEPECVVMIDWSALMKKEFLSEANVSVQTREPAIFKGPKTGTKLTITKLRGAEWTRGEVRRLLAQVTSIASPFARRSDSFEAILEVPDHPEWVSGIPDIGALLRRAPWHFSFSFEEGVLEWGYEFRGMTGLKLEPRQKRAKGETLLLPQKRGLDPLGTERSAGPSKPRKLAADAATSAGIGPVRGEFYVFDRDREVLARLGDSQLVQSFLNENSGVRVYRDGIRVYNYGEPGDDWLGLDLRRVNSPTRKISRNIVVGAIDLSLQQSSQLKEKTNREGFVENDAYERLQGITLGALSILETERKVDKDNLRSITDQGGKPSLGDITQPLQELREVTRKHHLSKELDPLISKAERDYKEMRETMLRAGISGMSLAIVFHEIEQGVRSLHDSIEAGRSLDQVQIQARELVHILDGFSVLLRKGEQRPNSLKQLIVRAREINSVRFRAHEVKLTCPFLEESAPDVRTTFAFGLILGALNNLLDNSFYWLQVRWPESEGPPRRELYINVEPALAEGPAIIVADNGPGFSDSPEILTRPFFTRRPEGMGIGLYYSNLAMELNGGRLAFPEPREASVPAKFDGAVLALVFGKEDN